MSPAGPRCGDHSANTQFQLLQQAAGKLGLQLDVLFATAERDFEKAFTRLTGLKAGGLVISGNEVLVNGDSKLAALALGYNVPAISQFRQFATAGGLLSYGSRRTDQYLVGRYAERILKGEKPADLPIAQTTKIELFVNMKTAKALGLTIPLTLLGRADEVIE